MNPEDDAVIGGRTAHLEPHSILGAVLGLGAASTWGAVL